MNVEDGKGVLAVKASPNEFDVSLSRISCKASGCSHGGGTILARRWRLSKRASQRGRAARCGGRRAGVVPLVGSVTGSKEIKEGRLGKAELTHTEEL